MFRNIQRIVFVLFAMQQKICVSSETYYLVNSERRRKQNNGESEFFCPLDQHRRQRGISHNKNRKQPITRTLTLDFTILVNNQYVVVLNFDFIAVVAKRYDYLFCLKIGYFQHGSIQG